VKIAAVPEQVDHDPGARNDRFRRSSPPPPTPAPVGHTPHLARSGGLCRCSQQPSRGGASRSIRRPPGDNEGVIARPELPENAETLFRAVAAVADALYGVDAAGRITFLNPARPEDPPPRLLGSGDGVLGRGRLTNRWKASWMRQPIRGSGRPRS
jgi:hypothetical protein